MFRADHGGLPSPQQVFTSVGIVRIPSTVFHFSCGHRGREHRMTTGDFDLPEFDELTNRRLVPKSALRDGAYCIGRCRNACVARWNAMEKCFYHWREKFGRIYIEKIKHPVDESEFDVFRVLEEEEADRKFEIPFDEDATFTGDPEALIEYNERVWCSCQTGVRPCIVHFQPPESKT